jgi:hypothetical protein
LVSVWESAVLFAVAAVKFLGTRLRRHELLQIPCLERQNRIEEESNMRTTAKWLAALGIIGVAALSVPSVASAQGVYFGVPGFGVGVGAPYYYGGPYYNYYNAPSGYGYGYDYGRHWYPHRYHHYWHHY